MMTWYSRADALAATASLGLPPSSLIPIPDRFGRGDNYRIVGKSGKPITRAAWWRTQPKEPKPKPYYLTIEKAGREVSAGEYETITKAKAAARALIARGEASHVDVTELAHGGRYLQGVMSTDGWSPV